MTQHTRTKQWAVTYLVGTGDRRRVHQTLRVDARDAVQAVYLMTTRLGRMGFVLLGETVDVEPVAGGAS